MPRSPQALFGFNAQGCPAKIEFTDFYQSGLELFQIHRVFFDFGVIEAAGLGLFCDFSFEFRTLGDELPVLLVAIGFETGHHFLLPRSIQRHRFQDHRLTVHLGHVVLKHLQAACMVVDLGKQTTPCRNIPTAKKLFLTRIKIKKYT